MAAKKDFTANVGRVHTQIAEVTAEPEEQEVLEVPQEKHRGNYKGTPHRSYSPEEKQLYEAEGKTQGRKGLKSARINFAFTPDNYDYIKTMSRASGLSLTETINTIIARHRAEHEDEYQQAQQFRISL